jgi:sugar phosphate isomerase/epimerase
MNNFPKLHNATWPGIVGKGPDSEPPISLDQLLEFTARAEVNGVKFDGIDIGLFEPHFNIDASDDDIKKFADKVGGLNLNVGSLVAPIWGGPAMGSKEDRAIFVEMVRKSCRFGQKLREFGVRPYGIIRIDSASKPEAWAADPVNNTKLIAQTFREACDVAADFGEKLAAEGEICWGGMHSWKAMVDTLEAVDRPNIGFQADMAHTLLYTLGYNSPEDRILPVDFQWGDTAALDEGLRKLTAALRPWTLDFHVAQNDGTVFGSGSHDKTGRHCQATDPNGKLDIARHAGFWLRDENGVLTKAFKHICWDGCMFPNEVLTRQQTWNDILGVMIKVRNAHGWQEA